MAAAPTSRPGLKNVMDKYGAGLIGVASTCLTETIGDDMPGLVQEFRRELNEAESPEIVTVSTPSYSGTHMEGFHVAVKAVVDQLAQATAQPPARSISCPASFPRRISDT